MGKEFRYCEEALPVDLPIKKEFSPLPVMVNKIIKNLGEEMGKDFYRRETS